jgi:hypothetical protein
MRAAAVRLAAAALCVALLAGPAAARKHPRGKAPKPETTKPDATKPDGTESPDVLDSDRAPKDEDEPGKLDKIDKPEEPPAPTRVEEPAPVETSPPTPTAGPSGPDTSEPALGFSDRPYVRTAGGDIVLYPSVRLQIDGAAYTRQTPKSGVYLRRARVGMAGWIGRAFYFDFAVDGAPAPSDPTAVAPSVLPVADAYLALAPAGDLFIVQVGQFDAPFTLENRTSDAYTDFIERAMVARSLGAPRNKEVGAMAHGRLGTGWLYYSGGVFNGNGPGYRNVDNQADAIGRITLAPFAGRGGTWRRLWIGGSGWYGRHVAGPVAPVEATPGGVIFFQPRWTNGDPPGAAMELREDGTLTAAGAELNVPLGRRLGLRGEFVWKRQHLLEADTSLGATPPALSGHATLEGLAGYGELWCWLLGDAELLPLPGLQLPARRQRQTPRLDDGLLLALRGEILQQQLRPELRALGDPNALTTRVASGTAGLNYWRGAFVRLSVNYVLNIWSGNSQISHALIATGRYQHEILLRVALNL